MVDSKISRMFDSSFNSASSRVRLTFGFFSTRLETLLWRLLEKIAGTLSLLLLLEKQSKPQKQEENMDFTNSASSYLPICHQNKRAPLILFKLYCTSEFVKNTWAGKRLTLHRYVIRCCQPSKSYVHHLSKCPHPRYGDIESISFGRTFQSH